MQVTAANSMSAQRPGALPLRAEKSSLGDTAPLAQGREAGLDVLKCLAAFLVVCIHAPFPGTFGVHFSTIARCAVPVFFMISGYYFISGDHARQRRQIIKLVSLTFEANLIYLSWMILHAELKGDGMLCYLAEAFSAKSILKFLFFNESPFGFHLWYLSAILDVLILMKLVEYFHLKSVLTALLPFLLIGNLALGSYAPLLFGREIPTILTRNFIFFALPHFYLGYLLKKNDRLAQKLKNIHLCALIVFSIASGIFERFLLASHDLLNPNREAYLSSTLLACALLLFFAKNNEFGRGSIFQKIGQNHSMPIYIIHPIVMVALKYALLFIGGTSAYLLLAPVFIFMVTAALLLFQKKLFQKEILGISYSFWEKHLARFAFKKT